MLTILPAARSSVGSLNAQELYVQSADVDDAQGGIHATSNFNIASSMSSNISFHDYERDRNQQSTNSTSVSGIGLKALCMPSIPVASRGAGAVPAVRKHGRRGDGGGQQPATSTRNFNTFFEFIA